MSLQLELNLGTAPPTTRPPPGTTVVADRPILGRCVLQVRGVHATAITADRIEVIARARARGEAVPRTKPTTLAYGDFRVVRRTTMSSQEDARALTVRCPNCEAPAGAPCRGFAASAIAGGGASVTQRQRGPHPERLAAASREADVMATDPPTLTGGELRNELAGIRRSVESLGSGGITRKTAAANVARRIASLEDRLDRLAGDQVVNL